MNRKIIEDEQFKSCTAFNALELEFDFSSVPTLEELHPDLVVWFNNQLNKTERKLTIRRIE